MIQSQVILGKVVARLALCREWGRRYGQVLKTAETIELLKRQMDLRPVRNTSIIEIRVSDEDAAEGAQIANTIARVYADYRAARHQTATRSGLEALDARLKIQDAAIAEQQSYVDRLRSQLHITDASAESALDSPPQISAETLRRIESLRLESQTEYIRSKTLLDRLKTLHPQELAQAIPTAGIQDPTLSQLLEQQTSVEQDLVATGKEFGPQYAEVIKLRAQASDLSQRIQERANGILAGLDARVSALEQSLKDLSEEVAKATQSDIDRARASRPYFEAKRELDERQRFRQILYTKIAQESTDTHLPLPSEVEIVDEAFPPTRPFSPNRPRALALMVSGLLLSLCGLFLAKSAPTRRMAAAPA